PGTEPADGGVRGPLPRQPSPGAEPADVRRAAQGLTHGLQGFTRVSCSYRCNDRQGAAVAVHGTDDELVAHCLQGRREAFSELVLRHQRMVYSVARAMLGDAHAAEDMAQEAFLHAYGALSSYQAQGRFPAWLRRIVT